MKSSLLRLKIDLLKIHCMVANRDNVTAIDDSAETDKGDHWISTETGSHVLLDGEGNIKGGMGGKFSGLNMSDVKKKDGQVSHSSAISGAQKIHDKAKKEYDTQKREHPNWETSKSDFENPVKTTHKSDPADLFSTKGAAHTSHEFEDAEHAENYTNDIHSKLINAGYKESYGAGDEIRYTKGDHVYVVDHNLNDIDNEDSFKVSVKSGYIDSSLAGSEPIKKVETNAERDKPNKYHVDNVKILSRSNVFSKEEKKFIDDNVKNADSKGIMHLSNEDAKKMNDLENRHADKGIVRGKPNKRDSINQRIYAVSGESDIAKTANAERDSAKQPEPKKYSPDNVYAKELDKPDLDEKSKAFITRLAEQHEQDKPYKDKQSATVEKLGGEMVGIINKHGLHSKEAQSKLESLNEDANTMSKLKNYIGNRVDVFSSKPEPKPASQDKPDAKESTRQLGTKEDFIKAQTALHTEKGNKAYENLKQLETDLGQDFNSESVKHGMNERIKGLSEEYDRKAQFIDNEHESAINSLQEDREAFQANQPSPEAKTANEKTNSNNEAKINDNLPKAQKTAYENILEKSKIISNTENIKWGKTSKANAQLMADLLNSHGINASTTNPSGIKTEGRFAAIGSPTNGILINPSSPFWKDPVAAAKSNFDNGHLSSENPVAVVLHEIAHTVYDPPSTWQNRQRQEVIAEKVGKYAKTNPKEFVSEVFAGIHTGKKYDDDVMTLYNSFTDSEYSRHSKFK
jgi:hypothetical protein